MPLPAEGLGAINAPCPSMWVGGSDEKLLTAVMIKHKRTAALSLSWETEGKEVNGKELNASKSGHFPAEQTTPKPTVVWRLIRGQK